MRAAGERSDPTGVEIGGHDEAGVGHALRARGRLAARRGGEVEDPLSRLGIERGDDGLARLILGRDAAVADRRVRPDVAAFGDDQRVGREHAALHVDAGVAQLAFDVGDRRAHPVHAQRHRRRFVVERERRERIGPPELVDEHADDPVGMRGANAEVHDLVAGGPRPGRSGARERTQHTVHVAAHGAR